MREMTVMPDEAPAVPPPRRSIWRVARPFRDAAAVVLGQRVLFLSLAWAGAWLLATGTGPLGEGFLSIWDRWDASILLRIAEHGYGPLADPHPTAFFPLFPLLVRGLLAAGVAPVAAGLAISAASCVVAFAYLKRLADEEIGIGAGRRAVLYLAVFPTGVFLIAPYTEALFLAGAIPAFYYARRGAWAKVALPAAVAVGARFAGVFLLMGLAVEFLRRGPFTARSVARAMGALTVAATPLAAYIAYLLIEHGNAFAFVADQRDGWGRTFVGPIRSFVTTLNADAPSYPTNWLFAWRVELVAAAIGVAIVAIALRKREWGYATYMAATMAVLLTSTWYYSIPRMLLSLFPAVLFLAARTERRPREHDWIVAAFAASCSLGVIVFTRGIWFF